MKRILLVEPDEQVAARLFELLAASGDYAVSAAPTPHEAALLLGHERQDIALLPVELLPEALPALRDLQPDLAVVALAPPGVLASPELAGEQIQGVLPHGVLETALPGILNELFARESAAQQPAGPSLDDRSAELAAVLPGVELDEKVLSALVSASGALSACSGALETSQAEEVAAHVASTWLPGHTAAIQFLRLPSRSGDLLLYTRPLGRDYLLTLVARPEAPLGALRRQADSLHAALAPGLLRNGAAPSPVAARDASPAPPDEPPATYAVVWRSLYRMPLPLQLSVRRIIEQLAADHGYPLEHLVVRAGLVHLLVRCPHGCRVDEVVRRLKEGVTAELRAQSGLTSLVWARGFYAVRAGVPLNDAELAPFTAQTP
jgi:hypothetical protein